MVLTNRKFISVLVVDFANVELKVVAFTVRVSYTPPYCCMDIQYFGASAMSMANFIEVRLQLIHLVKGRGAASNLQGQYGVEKRERFYDGWGWAYKGQSEKWSDSTWLHD
jgi:hypothetical protein